MDGTIDLLTDTVRAMLVTSVYVANPDDDFVDAGGVADPIDAEISVVGYVPGFGGAGRRTLASKTIVEDDANNRAEFSCAALLWSALGAGATIAALIFFKNGTVDDTTSKLIGYVDQPTGASGFPITTNGSDVTITPNAEGLLQGV